MIMANTSFVQLSYRRRSDGGKFLIKRKSRRDRMRVKVQAIKQELRRRMHQPIPGQGKWLKRVVQGYINYDAVSTNHRALTAFRMRSPNAGGAHSVGAASARHFPGNG